MLRPPAPRSLANLSAELDPRCPCTVEASVLASACELDGSYTIGNADLMGELGGPSIRTVPCCRALVPSTSNSDPCAIREAWHVRPRWWRLNLGASVSTFGKHYSGGLLGCLGDSVFQSMVDRAWRVTAEPCARQPPSEIVTRDSNANFHGRQARRRTRHARGSWSVPGGSAVFPLGQL